MASIAERLSMACARTFVSEEKQLFLGELSMSYLSAAPVTVSAPLSLSLLCRLCLEKKAYLCVRFCRVNWWLKDQW